MFLYENLLRIPLRTSLQPTVTNTFTNTGALATPERAGAAYGAPERRLLSVSWSAVFVKRFVGNVRKQCPYKCSLID